MKPAQRSRFAFGTVTLSGVAVMFGRSGFVFEVKKLARFA